MLEQKCRADRVDEELPRHGFYADGLDCLLGKSPIDNQRTRRVQNQIELTVMCPRKLGMRANTVLVCDFQTVCGSGKGHDGCEAAISPQ